MRVGTTFFLILFLCKGFGQSNDSLENRLLNVSDIEKPKLLLTLCDANINHDNEKALSYAEQAIKASEEFKDSNSLMKASILAGELLTAFERYTEARMNLDRALALGTAFNDELALSDIHGAYGGLYYSLFDHESSLHHYQKGIEIARKLNNVRLLVKNMSNMAGLLEVQGEYELALKTFVECSEVLVGTEWENHRFYYLTLLNSGMVCNSMGDHRTGVVYLKRALKGFEDLDASDLEVHTLVGLVQGYTKLGMLDSAWSYHMQTIEIDVNQELSSRRHFRDQIFTELLFEMKHYNAVIAQSKATLKEIGDDTTLTVYAANAAEMAYKSNKKLSNTGQALHYLELFNGYNEYLLSKKTEEEVKALRTRFETELDYAAKNREVLSLQLQGDIQQKEIEKQKYWRNFILSIALLGFIISLLILYNLRLQKQASAAEQLRLETVNAKLKMEVEHKNRELTSTAMFVAQKNQMLMELQDHLSKLTDSQSSISEKDLRNIRNKIRGNIRFKEDWEKVKLHFEEVYPKFFQNLTSTYPKLTSLELKHCAYLRMNLSVKEVARILNVEPKSVQMSHYRLKKKLGLGSDDVLSAHIADY